VSPGIPIVAVPDAYSTNTETAVTISPLANDIASDNSTLPLLTWVTQPLLGSLTSTGNGSYVYTPTGVAGTDSFSYNLSDGVSTAIGSVNVTVGELLAGKVEEGTLSLQASRLVGSGR
jgi:hypothetical protein